MPELSRRQILKAGAAATAVSLFNINHAWSQDTTWDGQPFDAQGAVFNLGDWGGFWEETQRKLLINQFEKDFNCKVQYDSSWPWFPKYSAGGPSKPAMDMTNWNLPELYKTAKAGDYFVSMDEIKANCPNAADQWDFASSSGHGMTWAFAVHCFVYRPDLVPAPTSLADFWKEDYAGKRGTYITSNTLQMVFFMAACKAFGSGETDWDAGYEAMRKLKPLKISDYTGNMTTLVERGEVGIAVQNDAEAYLLMEKGVNANLMIWNEYPALLTQTKTVSRGAGPIQKKLAYAYMDRTLSAEYQTAFADAFWMRPTNKKVILPEKMTKRGVANNAASTDGLLGPNWDAYVDSEFDIVETVNEIFAS